MLGAGEREGLKGYHDLNINASCGDADGVVDGGGNEREREHCNNYC